MDTLANLRHVGTDDEFTTFMGTAGDSRLIVVDFYTSWCQPCREMSTIVNKLAEKFPRTLFVKVNAEKCMDTATQHNISGVPSFIFYRKNAIIDHIKGKDPELLERKIQLYDVPTTPPATEYLTGPGAKPASTSHSRGLGNLSSYLDRKSCRCFNDLSVSSFQAFLDGHKLTSGKGVGKLLMLYAFTQPMLLQHFKIKAAKHTAPKILKFYINQPSNVDFENLTELTPAQENALSEADLLGESSIEFQGVRLQPVTTLHVLVTENMPRTRKVEIDLLNFYGLPVSVIDYPLNAGAATKTPATNFPTMHGP